MTNCSPMNDAGGPQGLVIDDAVDKVLAEETFEPQENFDVFEVY